MPYVRVTSNAKRSSVDMGVVVKTISKHLAAALGRPEAATMVDVQLDRDMCFNASTELCAFVEIRNIGLIDKDHNPATVSAMTASVSTLLTVPRARVFVNLVDISATNWGANGNVVG